MTARKPHFPWIIGKPHYGAHTVRDRESGAVIGQIHPCRQPGRGLRYVALRPDSTQREFAQRFDAAHWLICGFDAAVSAGWR